MTTRVSVYIDGANLFHGSEMIGVRIDFQKLKNIIKSDRILVDLKFYNCVGTNLGTINFHKKLESFGYNLKFFVFMNMVEKVLKKRLTRKL